MEWGGGCFLEGLGGRIEGAKLGLNKLVVKWFCEDNLFSLRNYFRSLSGSLYTKRIFKQLKELSPLQCPIKH